jgi:15-cis-phytoene synthase
VSEPPLALIRLQWWREVVEGAHRRHEVAEPLLAAIEAGQIVRGDLLPLIDARETEAVTAFATTEEWRCYLFGSAGGLAVAAARLLGAPDPERLRALGAAYGIAGVLRSVPVHARQGRCLLPADALAAHGLSPEQVIRAPSSARAAVNQLAKEAIALLQPMRLPRQTVAATLSAVLARRDLLRAPVFSTHRGLGDRLAVTIAGLTGRI